MEIQGAAKMMKWQVVFSSSWTYNNDNEEKNKQRVEKIGYSIPSKMWATPVGSQRKEKEENMNSKKERLGFDLTNDNLTVVGSSESAQNL